MRTVLLSPFNTAITLGYIKNFNATTINELRGNFTRFADNQLSDNSGINCGIPQIQVEAYPTGNLQVAGVIQGTDTPAILAQNTYEVRDTLTKGNGQSHRSVLAANTDGSRTTTICSEAPGRFILFQVSGIWPTAPPSSNRSTPMRTRAAQRMPLRYFRDHLRRFICAGRLACYFQLDC